MYFPKSQTKTNLYTNGGEFTIQQSNTPYTGYYYETSKGEYYSGKTPNESPTFKLSKIQTNTLSTPNLASPIDRYYILENGYLKSTTLPFSNIPPRTPKQSYPV